MVMFPSSKEFIENKKISDRTYAWCLLNGSYNENGIYIDKNYNSGARDLGIDRRTFKKRLQILIENGYIEERENCYVIPRKELQYKRYIYRDIAEGLYNSGMENIIKLFIVLSTYHDRYKGNQNEDFSYRLLLKRIGLPYDNHDMVQNNKIENMLNKLVELGLLEYERSPRYNSNNFGAKQFVVTRIGD